MIFSQARKGFTLLEMLIAMVIFFIMTTVVTTLFVYIYKTKGALEARQTITKESYFFLEKLQVMVKDYTIDYEEYWNRQQVGCMSPGNATWNTGWNCSMMTYYGNKNAVLTGIDANNYNGLYYFSTLWDLPPWSFDSDGAICTDDTVEDCVENTNSYFTSITTDSWFIQSYGQYQQLFKDVKDDVDFNYGPVKDDDDLDMGKWPIAIVQTGQNFPQELYLISHDKTKRLLFRRKVIESGDYNGDTIISDSEKLFSVQVLQLKWFDAGETHNFDDATTSRYDGIIDTWACDYDLWFICDWESISSTALYSGFRLPQDINDGWQNILNSDITVSDRNIVISPLSDPYLSRSEDNQQISPFFTMNLTLKLYGKNWNLKIPRNQMDRYNLLLQTTFSTML